MAQNVDDIRYEEKFITNKRGLVLFTCRWLPENQEPKALILLCHGYSMECSFWMKGIGTRMAKAGYAVYGIDHEGHGKSSGLLGYTPSFDNLVNDFLDYFTSVCETDENKKKLRFLWGESMGAAVALLMHREKPQYWDGAVLVAPMCKIADSMKPHPIVIYALKNLAKVIPTWKIVPSEDFLVLAIKSPQLREEVRNNPLCYKGRPRLKTALELLRVSMDIEKNLDKVSLPFIIVHGGADIVTDPSVSKLLYESASSTDKAFKLYPGMWHTLTAGEPPESLDLVFSDIITWLDERTSTWKSRSETDQKARHDNPSS
ncbi:hypothetical protein MRB53_011204 [Persea americana]|uniref:Uncharacterized protein n=1 Tax=Persea americana TaxID=3435 RepID=A0ACC2LU72_PERAE|nr:hypothetical protein MRB53_011204 [Persea americana]